MVLTLLHGAYCVIAQAVLLRELGDLFRGDEAVLGIFLAAWLAGGGMGTWVFARFPERMERDPRGPARALFISSLFLPAAVLGLRLLYAAFRFASLPSFPLVSALAFCTTAPVGLAAGFTFSFLAQRAFPDGDGAATRYAHWGDTARAYLGEAAGAFAGGMLYAFVLVGRVDGLAAALAFCAAVLYLPLAAERSSRRWKAVSAAAALAIFSLALLSGGPLAFLSRRAQFWGSTLESVSRSPYGTLAITRDDGQESDTYNGKLLYDPREASWEEAALLPALVAGSTGKVLFLGFPPPPLVSQFAKLRPKEWTAVFRDPSLAHLLEGRLDPADRPTLVPEDPFRAVGRCGGPFDLILLLQDLPDSVAGNRYFSDRFFTGLKGMLAPKGVLALSVPYEENQPDPGGWETQRILDRTLSACFPHRGFVAGERFLWFASESPLALGQGELLRRLGSLPFRPEVVNRALLDHYLGFGRSERFEPLVTSSPKDPVNGPFSLELYRASFMRRLRMSLGLGWAWTMLMPAVLLPLVWGWRRTLMRSFLAERRSGFLFGTGFAVLAVEVALLQDYQSVSGFLFERYALLTAAFMLGSAVGARASLTHPERPETSRRPPAAFAVSLMALALWAAAAGLLRRLGPQTGAWEVDAAAGVLNLLGGLASGAAFTVAAREMMGRWQAKVVSMNLYAFDLFGSALAAVLAPFVLIPFLGTALTQAGAAVLLAVLSILEFRRLHAAH